MRTPLARALLGLCWPALVPLAATVAWLRSRAAPVEVGAAWAVAPYLALGAAAALAARFRRDRLVLAAVTLGLGAAALTRWTSPIAFQAVAALVPLDLALFALLGERGLFTPAGAARWGLLAAQAVLLGVLVGPSGHRLGAVLGRPLFGAALPAWTPLGHLAALACALAALTLLGRYAFTRGPVESGLLGALGAFLMALHTAPGSTAFRVYLAAAGVVLLLALVETSYALAFRDQLTGLPGRRALEEALQRLSGGYTVAMVDVDHFKKFNDKYGHDAGDQVLRMVAAKLARVEGGGRSFRYGGEEFTVLFPGRTLDESRDALETLRASIADSPFAIRGPDRPRKKPKSAKPAKGGRKDVSVTVSIGAAEHGGSQRPAEVVKSADQQLYKAKKAGRNCVCP
jgi:diguanylate cyclase (GGDEF)-like protein